MKKYEKYRDSRIEWIGQMPNHWNASKLKWLSDIYAGGTPSTNIEGYWENGTIPWLNSGTVNQKRIKVPSGYITEEAVANSSTKWVPKGSLLMALAGQGKTKGIVAILEIDATCNQSMAAIVPDLNEIDSEFLFFWLDSNYYRIRGLAGTELRDGLNLEIVGGIQCPIPPIVEQIKIAKYLNHQTAIIEQLIQQKERLIELLKEKRQALINEVVTKGLTVIKLEIGDIEAYAKLFFTKGDHKEKLQPILNEVVKRYESDLDEDQKVAFKANIKDYVRLYRFLSQIITFTDVQLEKYYVFLSDLFKKLPASPNALPKEVLEEIDLESYKLQHQFTTDLQLQGNNTAMQGMTPGGAVKKEDEEIEWLTKIIKVLNDTYGLDLKEEDKVEFEKMKKNIYSNDELMSFFNNKNSKDNIQDKFNEEIDNELLNFINTKLELYNKLSEDKVNDMFKRLWFNDIYDKQVRGITTQQFLR